MVVFVLGNCGVAQFHPAIYQEMIPKSIRDKSSINDLARCASS